MSVAKIGNNEGHTIGSMITATIGGACYGISSVSKILHATDVLAGVVLSKSQAFAELSSATDEANLVVAKTMLNAQIAELEASLPTGSKLKQLEL